MFVMQCVIRRQEEIRFPAMRKKNNKKKQEGYRLESSGFSYSKVMKSAYVL